MFTQLDKAIVPFVVMVVMAIGSQFGIREDMTAIDAVTALVTAAVVWLVPNKKAQQ